MIKYSNTNTNTNTNTEMTKARNLTKTQRKGLSLNPTNQGKLKRSEKAQNSILDKLSSRRDAVKAAKAEKAEKAAKAEKAEKAAKAAKSAKAEKSKSSKNGENAEEVFTGTKKPAFVVLSKKLTREYITKKLKRTKQQRWTDRKIESARMEKNAVNNVDHSYDEDCSYDPYNPYPHYYDSDSDSDYVQLTPFAKLAHFRTNYGKDRRYDSDSESESESDSDIPPSCYYFY